MSKTCSLIMFGVPDTQGHCLPGLWFGGETLGGLLASLKWQTLQAWMARWGDRRTGVLLFGLEGRWDLSHAGVPGAGARCLVWDIRSRAFVSIRVAETGLLGSRAWLELTETRQLVV